MTQEDFHPQLANYQIQNVKLAHLIEDMPNWCAQDYSEVDRSIAVARLKFLDFLLITTLENIKKFPSLQEIFEEKFQPLEKLQRIDYQQHMAITHDEIFPRNDLFSIKLPVDIALSVLDSYFEGLTIWWQTLIDDHEKTQLELRENFSEEINLNESRCGCTECVHIYRTRLRESVYDRLKKFIEDSEEKLHEEILYKKINDISFKVQLIKKELDRTLDQTRFKLKRSSLNKLESDLKVVFNKYFAYQSTLVKVYQEQVKAFLNGILIEEKIGLNHLNEEDYAKFFKHLNTNIWRVSTFLKKEFLAFIHTILTLKRKDISSTILKEYLGQFWLHSPARRINRKITYHMGPTNSGKTYQAIQALCKAKKGSYLAPLRLLASELFDTMNNLGVVTTLLTGEEVIEKPDATHFSSTIEMAKLHDIFDCCVIDEIQMISDPQRGWAWTRALVNMNAPEIHLCGDGSVLELIKSILLLTGDTLEVKQYERMTELKVLDGPVQIRDLEQGDAVIVFSRRNALKFKAELEKLNFKVSIIYGMLSPEVRREQARKFDEGETDIIVSTDAIAMGMNLPVRRIVFSSFSKFIDGREYPLSISEVKQISGRAGRFGRFPVGYVTCIASEANAQGIATLRKSIHGELDIKTVAMVGPDLDIFSSVNKALEENKLRQLDLSEFLRLFNTMTFQKPFNCVQLSEMIELTEIVEKSNENYNTLSMSEIFGFACAPVNLGLIDHLQYFVSIVNRYVQQKTIHNDLIDSASNNIDYMETAIKCVELFQWLARHFDNKNFSFDLALLMENKARAIEKLNHLLSEKSSKYLFNMSDRYSFDKERKRSHSHAQQNSRTHSNSGSARSPEKRSFHAKPKPGVHKGPGKWKNRTRQK